MSYEDHIEQVAAAAQRAHQADERRQRAFIAPACLFEPAAAAEREAQAAYIAALDAAEAFCDEHGIAHRQLDLDVESRLGL
jgi:hypothetical protein